MKRRSPPAVPSGYAEAWARLFSRSPEELQAERQSRQPSPAPRTPNAQEGAKSAPQRTQAAPSKPYHLRKEPKL